MQNRHFYQNVLLKCGWSDYLLLASFRLRYFSIIICERQKSKTNNPARSLPKS